MNVSPILVYSSYILEGWLMFICSSFIGRVTYAGLYLLVLLHAGLSSVVLQDGWPI